MRPEPALDEVLRTSRDGGLPPISVSAPHGRFLAILAQAAGARRVLEIGTLGGYSTICLARAVAPGGSVTTLEVSEHHASIARRNIAAAGLEAVVRIEVGDAAETLARLAADAAASFDFVFIDADKESYAEYFTAVLLLAKPGALIVADNVVREGAVIDPVSADPRVQGVRRFLDRVAAEPRVTATALQTVGSKGYDGMALIRVNSIP